VVEYSTLAMKDERGSTVSKNKRKTKKKRGTAGRGIQRRDLGGVSNPQIKRNADVTNGRVGQGVL